MLAWLWRLKDWQQHVVIALAIQAVYAAIFGALSLAADAWCYPFTVGAIAATHQFYGREERDHENKVHSDTETAADWAPWRWGPDERSDFLAPTATVWAAAAIAEAVRALA